MINKSPDFSSNFVTIEEIEKLLKNYEHRDSKLFHVCIIPKNSKSTQEQQKLRFIQAIIDNHL